MTLISFLFFLALFVLIGLLSMLKSKKTSVDYLVADHSIAPWLSGLSAVATNNSGYMFTGMIGFTYMTGLSSVWLMIGWILGDYCGSTVVHKKLRVQTEATGRHSFSGILSHWNGQSYRKLRVLCGIFSVVFLGVYAAAQFKAGGKVLYALLGWQMHTGAVIGGLIVLAYCFAGGIRASIWTDAAQSVVMLVSMAVLFFTAVNTVGGLDAALTELHNIEAGYMNWLPSGLAVPGVLGFALFIAGWMFAGLGVIGQPHIMIRFMALNDPQQMGKTRLYYYAWFTVFYGLTIAVGLMARLLVPEASILDAELALPELAKNFLPPILIGLILAGFFSAIISTADSLILSCSASLTRDFFPSGRGDYRIAKIGTLAITCSALLLAICGNDSVFKLVLYAWAVLASAFGPLLLVYCFGGQPSEKTAIGMVAAGVVCAFLWSLAGLSGVIYEVAPGMAAGILVFLGDKILRRLRASAL